MAVQFTCVLFSFGFVTCHICFKTPHPQKKMPIAIVTAVNAWRQNLSNGCLRTNASSVNLCLLTGYQPQVAPLRIKWGNEPRRVITCKHACGCRITQPRLGTAGSTIAGDVCQVRDFWCHGLLVPSGPTRFWFSQIWSFDMYRFDGNSRWMCLSRPAPHLFAIWWQAVLLTHIVAHNTFWWKHKSQSVLQKQGANGTWNRGFIFWIGGGRRGNTTLVFWKRTAQTDCPQNVKQKRWIANPFSRPNLSHWSAQSFQSWCHLVRQHSCAKGDAKRYHTRSWTFPKRTFSCRISYQKTKVVPCLDSGSFNGGGKCRLQTWMSRLSYSNTRRSQ